MVEENKEKPDPLVLDKNEVKTLFAQSGVDNDKMEEFDRHFDETAGKDTEILASNVVNTKSFEVKTPDVVIKVKSERTDLIGTRTIDGLPCLVVRLDGDVVVNILSASQAIGAISSSGTNIHAVWLREPIVLWKLWITISAPQRSAEAAPCEEASRRGG